jgi:ferric hydroxamate transport system substrate-binding protein
MQKAVLYGIIAAVVVAASVGVAFAAMSMNNAAEPAVANQQPTDDNDVRVIKHAMGETEITGTPGRVVVLYSIYAGDVRALGVQPVGIVDRDWINGWLTPIGYPLSEDVVNIGIPNEPNMETILQLEPDLIIGLGGKWGEKHIEMYDEFSEIAPTLLFNPDPRPELDELEVAKQNFMAIADALNRHDEGIAWLENMEARYDEASKKIEQAGYKGAKVILTTAYLQNDVPEMFIFTEDAFATLLLNKMGLVNKVPDPADTTDTWYRTGMEGLATVDGPDVHLIVSYNAGQYDTNPLEKSPLWDNLEFVKNGRVHDIGNTRLFGQVLFAEDIANRVVGAMTEGKKQSVPDQTRTISHDMGETEITGTPQRIIPLDTVAVEVVLALGGQAVGMGSLEDHKIWTPEISTKWPDVTSVGETWEPNLEVMAQLEPDLIIGMQAAHSGMYDDLSAIAPTILLDNWPPEGGPTMLEAVEQNTMTIADALNRHDKGVAFLEGFHAKIDENAAKLEAAGLDGASFILADTRTFEGAPEMRLYVPNSQNSEILERMGLENAVTPPGEFQRFGSIDAGLEALTTLDGPDVHFIYVSSPFPGSTDPLTDPAYWKDNPVWAKLQFVQEGNVYRLDPVNFFRGPLELEKLADRSVNALTGR